MSRARKEVKIVVEDECHHAFIEGLLTRLKRPLTPRYHGFKGAGSVLETLRQEEGSDPRETYVEIEVVMVDGDREDVDHPTIRRKLEKLKEQGYCTETFLFVLHPNCEGLLLQLLRTSNGRERLKELCEQEGFEDRYAFIRYSLEEKVDLQHSSLQNLAGQNPSLQNFIDLVSFLRRL